MTAASFAVLAVIVAAIGIIVAARVLGLSLGRHAGVIAVLIVAGVVASVGECPTDLKVAVLTDCRATIRDRWIA